MDGSGTHALAASNFRRALVPLSGAGKVLKRELREPYRNGFAKAVN